MQGAQYSSSSSSSESSSSGSGSGSGSSEQQHNGSNGLTTDAATASTTTAARCADLRKYAQHLVLQYRATLHLNAGAEGGQRVSTQTNKFLLLCIIATIVQSAIYLVRHNTAPDCRQVRECCNVSFCCSSLFALRAKAVITSNIYRTAYVHWLIAMCYECMRICVCVM
jgi:hypothetical protein